MIWYDFKYYNSHDKCITNGSAPSRRYIRTIRVDAILQSQYRARWIVAAEERETRALYWPRSWPRRSAASPSQSTWWGTVSLHLRRGPRCTVSFTAALFSQRLVRPLSFFLVACLHGSSKSRESQWSKLPEEDICGCDSALALKRNGRSSKRRREKERDLMRSELQTEKTDRNDRPVYRISDSNFNNRFIGSFPEFGVDIYLGKYL